MAKRPDEKYGLFINGEFRDSKDGKFFDTYSPATKEKIASVAEATKEDVDDAVNAAWAAFDSWKNLDKIKRAEILLKIADVIDANKEDLAYIESLDNGKCLLKCNGGAQRFPQPGWQSGVECKCTRELDCETGRSSRDESRD